MSAVRKVVLYCRELDQWGKGAAEYTRETAAAVLRKPDPRLAIHVVAPEGSQLPASQTAAELVTMPRAHRLWQDHWHASRIINRLRPDVVWLPKNVIPLGMRGKAVVSFLDFAYFVPELHAYGRGDTVYMKAMMRRSAKRGDHFVAISEATRRDAGRFLGVPESRVSVIYPSISDKYLAVPSGEEKERVRAKYGLPPHYIFFAGGLTPRKNLPRLVKAYAQVCNAIPHDLVLTGTAVRRSRELFEAIAPIEGRVHRLGRVADEDIHVVHHLASIYAHVSLYEGFGYTVVEAQAQGVPVLNSNVSCMPEVGGEGALYVDPYDVEAMADGLQRLASDAALCEELRRKGTENARRFGWDQSGAQLQEVLATC